MVSFTVHGVVATVVVGVDSDVLPGGALGRGAAWRGAGPDAKASTSKKQGPRQKAGRC